MGVIFVKSLPMFLFPITPKGWKSRSRAKVLFKEIVAQARQTVFYADLDVPDTLDGRFEMIAMHTGLVINRVRTEGEEGTRFAQSLFDEMFLNMELSCRQIGIGDLSVPRHMKRMMVALQGRALHYEEAAEQGESAVADALKRNLYATVETPSQSTLLAVAQYFLACRSSLKAQSYEDIKNGRIAFAPLPIKESISHEQNSQTA